MKAKKIQFWLVLTIIAFGTVVSSCEKSEYEMPPGFQYGPGVLLLDPGIVAHMDSTLIRFDYRFSYMGYNNSSYDLDDSTIQINRSVNVPFGKQFTFKIWNINLEHMHFPITLRPNHWQTDQPNVTCNFSDEGIYKPKQNDSTQFWITIAGYLDQRISGTFEGKLYKELDTSIYINITNGQFDVELKNY